MDEKHETNCEHGNPIEEVAKPRVLRIHLLGSPVLREVSAEVPEITDDIRKLADLMVATMKSVKGIGLAAPQVGIPLRIFVMEEQRSKDILQLMNPTIDQSEGEQEIEEGCLSQPMLGVKMKRPQYLVINAIDIRTGSKVMVEGSDLEAAILSHELDHLNGTMLCDYLSRLKRDLYKRKLAKVVKRVERHERGPVLSNHRKRSNKVVLREK